MKRVLVAAIFATLCGCVSPSRQMSREMHEPMFRSEVEDQKSQVIQDNFFLAILQMVANSMR